MAAEAAQTAAAPPPELEQAHAAPPIDDAAWQRTEGYLAGLAEALAKRNPDALLLIQATAPWDPDIAARLGEIAARHEHIEYLPLEAVAALPEGERRLAYDGHWSRRVHELAAEALFERLKTRLPAAAP
ncbi:MAG: hypothetical protein GC168_08665 [Candidatus Hydrogenedens sp.]|nr:hypothetical protein [Candidatus Hydrogenedens sp.]